MKVKFLVSSRRARVEAIVPAKHRPVARDFERGVLFDQKWTFSKGPNIVTVLLEWLTALLEYLDLALHLIHAMNELLEALNLVSY